MYDAPAQTEKIKKPGWKQRRSFYIIGIAWMWLSYFGVEVYASRYLAPFYDNWPMFGALWALLLTSVALLLPRWIGKLVYGFSFFFFAVFAAGQCGYYAIFGRLVWVTDAFAYSGEGGDYLGSVGSMFSQSWWFFTISLMVIGAIGCFLVPHGGRPKRLRCACAMIALSAAIGLFSYPRVIFSSDADSWGLDKEYKRALSAEGICETMYDAHKVYDICGFYQTTAKDVWKHVVYPRTPLYIADMDEKTDEIDDYLALRGAHESNGMSGIFEGKNVVVVLMESMDDWVLNENDTPTVCRLMREGINFTNFYTADFGSVRTFNTEFAVNTGMLLPTNGEYAFAYCTNDFSQSLPNLLRAEGYSAEAFHYNVPTFYNRGVMEPAMGYEAYNCYADFGVEGEALYDDCALFENEALTDLFYNGGSGDAEHFLSFIITRAAHMTYKYDEELSKYALEKYPQYMGSTGNEETDCMAAKARLCDDMFAALLQNLEENGELENTVIVALADHYSYGLEDQQLVMDKSGVSEHVLVTKTPFFIWSCGGTPQTVDKTLNTSDVLPTLVNMLGIESDYRYLGQDAFDESYSGFAVHQDGSWVTSDAAYQDGAVVRRFTDADVNEEEMNVFATQYINVNNLLLESDYYGR